MFSLGVLGAGEAFTKYNDSFGLNESTEELKGVKNYKTAVDARLSKAQINENEAPVNGAEEDAVAQDDAVVQNDNKGAIETRVTQLKDRESFVDGKKKAVTVANEKRRRNCND